MSTKLEETKDHIVECYMCGELHIFKPKYSNTPFFLQQYFCSEKCLENFGEWAVWQKDLGNGIMSDFYGLSPVGAYK